MDVQNNHIDHLATTRVVVLYAQALPRADELVLTEIDADLDGDVHFPVWDRAAFAEAAREAHTAADGTRFAFVTYRRKA